MVCNYGQLFHIFSITCVKYSNKIYFTLGKCQLDGFLLIIYRKWATEIRRKIRLPIELYLIFMDLKIKKARHDSWNVEQGPPPPSSPGCVDIHNFSSQFTLRY